MLQYTPELVGCRWKSERMWDINCRCTYTDQGHIQAVRRQMPSNDLRIQAIQRAVDFNDSLSTRSNPMLPQILNNLWFCDYPAHMRQVV